MVEEGKWKGGEREQEGGKREGRGTKDEDGHRSIYNRASAAAE